jgi:hypothetical protein
MLSPPTVTNISFWWKTLIMGEAMHGRWCRGIGNLCLLFKLAVNLKMLLKNLFFKIKCMSIANK